MFSWTARNCQTRGCFEENHPFFTLSFQWSPKMDRKSPRKASKTFLLISVWIKKVKTFEKHKNPSSLLLDKSSWSIFCTYINYFIYLLYFVFLHWQWHCGLSDGVFWWKRSSLRTGSCSSFPHCNRSVQYWGWRDNQTGNLHQILRCGVEHKRQSVCLDLLSLSRVHKTAGVLRQYSSFTPRMCCL